MLDRWARILEPERRAEPEEGRAAVEKEMDSNAITSTTLGTPYDPHGLPGSSPSPTGIRMIESAISMQICIISANLHKMRESQGSQLADATQES
jgi:hypothetical protein